MSERRPRELDEPSRASYLTDSARGRFTPMERAVNDGGGLVLVPLRELLDSIREAVGAALERAPSGPKLLDRAALAVKLDCSVSMVNKFMQRGMPRLYVGNSPRFAYNDVVRWMSEQKPEGKEEA